MAVDNIVLSLKAPSRLYVGSEGNEDGSYVLGGIRCRTGFPPWPSCGDLLVHSRARTLCGVTYQIPIAHRDVVRRTINVFDPRVVQYVPGDADARLPAYRDYEGDIDYFQITWTQEVPDAIEAAQLGSDVWYYFLDSSHESMPRNSPFAYGVGDLAELLAEHRLGLPSSFGIPQDLQLSRDTVGAIKN